MKKEELKYYLNKFSTIKRYIKDEYISVSNKKVLIPKWVDKLEEYLNIIYAANDEVVKEIIKKYYFSNIPDKYVIKDLPISEATYYRIKKEILNILYELYVLDGYVKQDDIVIKI